MYKLLILFIVIFLIVTQVYGQDLFYVSLPRNYGQFGYRASPDANFTMFYKVYNFVPQALGFN